LFDLFVFIWTKHGRKIRRWLPDYFRQRRGPGNLKPKSPEDCPLCDILYLKCQACGGCRTSGYATPLYWLKRPLSRIAMVMTAMSEGVDLSAACRIYCFIKSGSDLNQIPYLFLQAMG
jgi:hypothetical protein